MRRERGRRPQRAQAHPRTAVARPGAALGTVRSHALAGRAIRRCRSRSNKGPAPASTSRIGWAISPVPRPEQLAVALATHWREGIADLGNGQLLQWFRGVQKDHNVVRLLIEMRHERQLHVDIQLLRLILRLAPGIPPVWRGESIALPAILAHASQALEGNAEAAQWLHALYQHRVLEAYVEAGNAQMKDVLERWTVAGDAFDTSWKDALALIRSKGPRRGPDEAVNWDAAMYGTARSGPAAHHRTTRARCWRSPTTPAGPSGCASASWRRSRRWRCIARGCPSLATR
jgi:hypothetical protein